MKIHATTLSGLGSGSPAMCRTHTYKSVLCKLACECARLRQTRLMEHTPQLWFFLFSLLSFSSRLFTSLPLNRSLISLFENSFSGTRCIVYTIIWCSASYKITVKKLDDKIKQSNKRARLRGKERWKQKKWKTETLTPIPLLTSTIEILSVFVVFVTIIIKDWIIC